MSFVKQFFRPDEAAEFLSVHISTLRRWTNEGRIACVFSPGGHRRIPREALVRFGATANAR